MSKTDDARKKILARRAGFVAAAMASLAVDGCGKTDATRDAGVEMVPRPCLEPMPVPCLSVATVGSTPVPPPQPCLKAPSPPREAADGGAKKDCDPPYTTDANGQKHYKADCL